MKIEGTCLWFGPEIPWGYIGWGIYTNGLHEYQTYVHYKNITKEGQRNPKYRELKERDIVSFEVGEGYRNNGTQALKVRIITYAEDNDKGWATTPVIEENS